MNVTIPEFAESVTEGDLGRWLKAEGESVQAGEPIVELETEKATVEFEAPVAGTLVEIVHAAGAEVAVGAVIAYVEDGK